MRQVLRRSALCASGALLLAGAGCVETESDLFTPAGPTWTPPMSSPPPTGGGTFPLAGAADILNGYVAREGDDPASGWSAGFGEGAVIAGDLDGDSYDDLVFDAPSYTEDRDVRQRGAVFVVYGRASWDDEATVEPDAVLLYLGDGLPQTIQLAAAGDVDGDGYADFLVGVPRDLKCILELSFPGTPIPGFPDDVRGSTYLVYGGPARFAGQLPIGDVASELVDDRPCRGLGMAVASAGDLDGDGFADFAIGRDRLPPLSMEPGGGRVHLFYGGPERRPRTSALTDTAEATLHGRDTVNGFSTGLGTAGDVDGDGDSELLIAESSDEMTFPDGQPVMQAAVYLVAGGERLTGEVDATVSSRVAVFQGQDLHGASAVGLGDLDEDGLDDFALGGRAGMEGPTGGDVGALLFYGRPGGFDSSVPTTTADVVLRTADRYSLPLSIAGGDLDGDGHRDLALGDISLRDTGTTRQGGVLVLRGPGGRWTGDFALGDVATAYVGSEQVSLEEAIHGEESWSDQPLPDRAGSAVAGNGDFDGDGADDLIVSAPGAGDSLGRAYLLHGPAIRERPRAR